MQDFAEIWAQWGSFAYLGAAIWAFFEGETFVLFAAALGAATGLVDPWLLMLSVWVGSYSGDQLWFFLGRRYGPSIVKRIPGGERHLGKATRLLERYGDAFVLTFRFIYGVRNVASAVCGTAGMSHLRFAVLNFIAAGLWAASFVAIGWYVMLWIGEENIHWLLIAVAVTIAGYFGQRMLRNRWRRQSGSSAAPPATDRTTPPGD